MQISSTLWLRVNFFNTYYVEFRPRADLISLMEAGNIKQFIMLLNPESSEDVFINNRRSPNGVKSVELLLHAPLIMTFGLFREIKSFK